MNDAPGVDKAESLANVERDSLGLLQRQRTTPFEPLR